MAREESNARMIKAINGDYCGPRTMEVLLRQTGPVGTTHQIAPA